MSYLWIQCLLIIYNIWINLCYVKWNNSGVVAAVDNTHIKVNVDSISGGEQLQKHTKVNEKTLLDAQSFLKAFRICKRKCN